MFLEAFISKSSIRVCNDFLGGVIPLARRLADVFARSAEAQRKVHTPHPEQAMEWVCHRFVVCPLGLYSSHD